MSAQDAVSLAFARLADLPDQLARIEAQLARIEAQQRDLDQRLPPAWGDADAAAKALGVSKSTVRRLVASGEVPAMKVGRSVRIDLSKLRPEPAEEISSLAARARGR